MPIWDQFLTERDKQLQSQVRAKNKPFGFGNHPVLLVIDAYYGALGDRPLPILESVETWPASCGMDGWEAIYKMQDLLK